MKSNTSYKIGSGAFSISLMIISLTFIIYFEVWDYLSLCKSMKAYFLIVVSFDWISFNIEF